MAIITEGGQEASDNPDVLNGTRLLTLGPGTVMVECQADKYDATDAMAISLQMPNGATPWNGVPVPAGNDGVGLPGVIDDRTALIGTFIITPGDEGHMVLGFSQVGAGIATWRVTHVGG